MGDWEPSLDQQGLTSQLKNSDNSNIAVEGEHHLEDGTTEMMADGADGTEEDGREGIHVTSNRVK